MTYMLAALNSTFGYSNRYRLVREAVREGHKPYRWAVYKAVGRLDRNETGWLTPSEMTAWLDGAINGARAATRRADHAFITPRGVTLSR